MCCQSLYCFKKCFLFQVSERAVSKMRSFVISKWGKSVADRCITSSHSLGGEGVWIILLMWTLLSWCGWCFQRPSDRLDFIPQPTVVDWHAKTLKTFLQPWTYGYEVYAVAVLNQRTTQKQESRRHAWSPRQVEPLLEPSLLIWSKTWKLMYVNVLSVCTPGIVAAWHRDFVQHLALPVHYGTQVLSNWTWSSKVMLVGFFELSWKTCIYSRILPFICTAAPRHRILDIIGRGCMFSRRTWDNATPVEGISYNNCITACTT